MRIAYYIDTVIPTQRANMVHVMKMCQAFSDLGHTVTLLCDGSQKIPELDRIRKQYAVTDRFEIQTAYIPTLLRKYGHRLGAYYGAYKKAQVTVNCDCAYSRSAVSLYFARNRVRYVYETHMEPDLLNKQIERKILSHRNCVALVVISMALKKRYLELFPFLKPEFITVLHDAADIPRRDSCTKAELQTQDDAVKIGYIGHLYPGKCMETLLPLAKRCPQYRFHIVGGTDEWVTHWKAQSHKEQTDNLLFYGYVDNSKVENYYHAFDIMILPFSKNIRIGKGKLTNIGKWISPLKLFEAMAYGKAIIVSRLTTIEEVLVDGEDCVMVEPDDIGQWAKKLERLCEDAALQKRIGNAAREKLEREYTWLERARKAASLFE